MKKIILFSIGIFLLSTSKSQINLNKIKKSVTGKDTSTANMVNAATKNITGNNKGSLTNDDIINGLKEALTIGTQNSAKKLGTVDGFFKDAALKILMPPEAQKVTNTLRSMGMGNLVDKAILSMNRAAEDASSGVGEIFINAIKDMSIADGIQILNGGNTAATDYLKSTTTNSLTEKMRPVIETSLKKTDATKYWNDVFTNYNRVSTKKVETDLTAYVTQKAMDGIFISVAQEEQKIRKDPAAQVTGLLKKVFGN
jgi:DNA-directed RNA polymerase delta subunit